MNAEQLASFRDKVNSGLTYEGKTVKLGADIDLSTVCGENVDGKEISWEPIGNYGANTTLAFSGTFDGNNYEISNIYINEEKNYQAFFGINKGNIRNIKINGNINVTGNKLYTAGIVANNIGTISNCHNNVLVKGYNVIAGITASVENKALVEKCSNNVEIYSTYGNAGGIVGINTGTIKECLNKGYIHANITAGGIIAYQHTGAVYNCYNTGKIESGSAIGGICGAAGISEKNTAYVYNSFNVGNIIGSSWNGEIIGLNNANGGTSQTTNCYSSGITAEKLNNGQYSDNAFTNDIKEKVVDESTGTEKEVWKYNNGYPILKWQLQENQVAE